MNAISNTFYRALGVAFLALARAKNAAKGYDRARPFSTSDIERCVAYDMKVVDEWLEVLRDYTDSGDEQLRGKRVLELGPGADLGVALYLLSKGVRQYCAVDAFPLALSAPVALHDAMLARIGPGLEERALATIQDALATARDPDDRSMIRYVVHDDFDIAAAFEPGSFDFVFSQAAFEHFDDVEATIAQVTKVTRPGARLIAGIDLQTHSRWLRDMDPLNIYRHSQWLYKLFGFRGMPNRVQASTYEQILSAHGWRDVEMRVLGAADPHYFDQVRDALAPEFRKDESRNLWVVACATRGE